MLHRRHAPGLLAPVLVAALLPVGSSGAQRDGNEKPSLSLRASPSAGLTPLRVRLTVDVRGGANDFEDFYCPSVEWDFGDDARSETSSDCAPYEPGKSEIQRRYSTQHTFRYFGRDSVRIRFTLKQRDRIVASTTTNITLRQGAGDEDRFDPF